MVWLGLPCQLPPAPRGEACPALGIPCMPAFPEGFLHPLKDEATIAPAQHGSELSALALI